MLGHAERVVERNFSGLKPALSVRRSQLLLYGEWFAGREDFAIASFERFRLVLRKSLQIALPDGAFLRGSEERFALAIEAFEAQVLRVLHEDGGGNVLDDRVEERQKVFALVFVGASL